MWLYAGITLLVFKLKKNYISFKYSPFIKALVTKLKPKSQSAGIYIKTLGVSVSTSETLRYKSVENLSNISVHVPTHLKPNNEDQFGHYLAGLIDGDGHFSKIPQLVIVFSELDASLAYYLKGCVGYGNVYKVKNKKAVILVIANRLGLLKILNLINGKIRDQNKWDQVKKNVLSTNYFKDFLLSPLNISSDLNNHWLSGFTDADGSFQIKLITRNNKTAVRLNFQVDQKKIALLVLIKQFLGGNIGHRKSQDTFYYNSTSFGSAVKVINYFDHYHLLSSKHVNFLK